ncbi:MAG: DUF1838 family protein [Steroidobacteraceae bacterium]
MSIQSIRYHVTASLLALLPLVSVAAQPEPDDPVQQLEVYVRANGDTSGQPSATWATGTVYAYVPGEKPRALFGLEVLGMARYQRIDGGFLRLSREVGYYTDLTTGTVLERWHNPWLQRDVDVVPIQNDPVNRRFTVANINFRINQSGDTVAIYREVPLRYPNPLDPGNYPLYSSGEYYEAIEMFNTFARRSDLANPGLSSVASTGSWTRIGPWLPWMEMGTRPGYLVYHSRAFKPAQGLDGIPDSLLGEVRARHPRFLEAPAAFSAPDETSWTFFKKRVDARRKAAEAAP